jgi:hypothetical protein
MTHRRILVTASLFALAFGFAAFGQDNAQHSGESWLALIDNQKYAESWTQASSFFRGHIHQQQWADMVKGARAPLGPVKSRKLTKTTTATALPGAPDGEYTILQFQSSFQNKASAVETLTLMKDNGAWRSAGYFIN